MRNPDWMHDTRNVPTDTELEVALPGDWPAAEDNMVLVGMAYPSAVEATRKALFMARYLAGDYEPDYDEVVAVAESALFDIAGSTINTLDAMDLSDDLKVDLIVAQFFLNRWWESDDEDEGDDGEELVPA
jgi:hypothetical protein